MKINKLLIDTNVCLDAVLYRKPFAANALEITERAQQGNFEAVVAAHSFDTIFYFLRKKFGKERSYKGLSAIRKAFDVAPVNESVIDNAIEANWRDFEDAIHHKAAKAAGCNAIVTRNAKDFRKADLSILSPLEFLDRVKSSEEE